MKVSLKTITPNPEEEIVYIARVSSGREDKTEDPIPLVQFLIRNNHWSPFEHAFMTLEIVTSRNIGRQLLRHRSFTFQEFSQRYAEVTEMEPIELRRQAVKNRQSSENVFQPLIINPLTGEIENAELILNWYIKMGQGIYKQLLDAEVAKECARDILPGCATTTIYMSGSIRSWIHFTQERLGKGTQKEAQLIAREVREIFLQQLPIVATALHFNDTVNG